MPARAAAAVAALAWMLTLAAASARYAEAAELTVSPEIVAVGINFGGAEVAVNGRAPRDSQVIVKVCTEPSTVKLSKKGRVMGIFWMTTERAVVENMPSFYAVYSSQPVDTLLAKEEQIRLGVDAECTGIMRQATVTADSPDREPLLGAPSQEYISALRDIYIKKGTYSPCVSCHRTASAAAMPQSGPGGPEHGAIVLSNDMWQLRLMLPADTPLGRYEITAYYVAGSRVVSTESAAFTVQKSGLVELLSNMATQNAPAYGAISLLVVVVVGLGIGFVFPRAKH